MVVNPATAPVPVRIDSTINTVKAEQAGTWSVDISGTPSVNQAGTWNVGIAGTPNVNIANAGPLLTRDVDRPTAQPFNLSKALTFDAGFAFAIGGESIVPPGKQL